MNLRQTTHRPWPRAAVLLHPQSLQVSLAPLRCGWGPSPARQVSLAPLTDYEGEVAQGPTKRKGKTRRARELRIYMAQ